MRCTRPPGSVIAHASALLFFSATTSILQPNPLLASALPVAHIVRRLARDVPLGISAGWGAGWAPDKVAVAGL